MNELGLRITVILTSEVFCFLLKICSSVSCLLQILRIVVGPTSVDNNLFFVYVRQQYLPLQYHM